MGISRELALAVECCRWAFDRSNEAVVHELCEGIDWAMFVRQARFHRVQGLLWSCLSATDARVTQVAADALASDAVRVAADNLQAVADSRSLLGAFEDAGISLLFLKGVTLSALAYANPSIKAAVDVDVLVPQDRLVESARVLQRLGYRWKTPRAWPPPELLPEWHARSKESLWIRPEPRSSVDLHTRLSDNPRLIPAIGIASQRQLVEVGNGIRLPTLRLEELFAYLCVHGASSAWFRLKWVTDVAAVLHSQAANELVMLYRLSQELGAGRSAAQALLLADALYGTLNAAPQLRQALLKERANFWLFRSALRQLTGCGAPIEPTAQRLGTATIHLTQFLLLPGWKFKASELRRQMRVFRR